MKLGAGTTGWTTVVCGVGTTAAACLATVSVTMGIGSCCWGAGWAWTFLEDLPVLEDAGLLAAGAEVFSCFVNFAAVGWGWAGGVLCPFIADINEATVDACMAVWGKGVGGVRPGPPIGGVVGGESVLAADGVLEYKSRTWWHMSSNNSIEMSSTNMSHQ